MLIWIDTRMMLSDGLTKGSVDRQDLHHAMRGFWEIKYDYKVWIPKRKFDRTQSDNNSPYAHPGPEMPPRNSAAWEPIKLDLKSLKLT